MAEHEYFGEGTGRRLLEKLREVIAGKLSRTELKGAIDEALAEAAASGEFDGASVEVTDVKESTEDGGDNVVTFSDGKKLTVKNGKKGSKGDTPKKGTDYFTDEDKQELVTMVMEALPAAEGVKFG